MAGGRAWGGDLIVFVGPGVGHLTDLVLPGEGIFESFFARRVFDQLNLLRYRGIKVNGPKEQPSRFLQVQLISVWLIHYNHL